MEERSEAQKEASRINGAKSKGPKTEEGKAISAQNARTHGLSAHSVIIDGESEEAWLNLKCEYHAEWQPVGPTERDMVTQLAYAAFRLDRIIVMECARLNYEQGKARHWLAKSCPNFDPPLQQAVAYEQGVKQLESMSRHEARLKRQIKDAIKTLQELQDRRRAAESAAQKKEQNEPESGPKFYSINNMIDAGLVPGLGPNDPTQRQWQRMAKNLERAAKLRPANPPSEPSDPPEAHPDAA